MKRSFWSIVFLAMTILGAWTVYVGAQEIQDLIVPAEALRDDRSADKHRYQFVDHYFMHNGIRYEIFLRLDRVTGKTWRYHASQAAWTEIGEEASGLPANDGTENRFELMSHVYYDEGGTQHEQFVRVDSVDGLSWKYKGLDRTWTALKIPGNVETVRTSDEPVPPAAD
jgi:hypothetical protein